MTCTHHWVLDSPANGVSNGECKLCGALRTWAPIESDFNNAFSPRHPRFLRDTMVKRIEGVVSLAEASRVPR